LVWARPQLRGDTVGRGSTRSATGIGGRSAPHRGDLRLRKPRHARQFNSDASCRPATDRYQWRY